MISQKTKYGLKAVICLARKTTDENILITTISKEERIPQKFLEAILLELRKKGLLKSKKGKGGGYSLGKPSSEITLGEIVRILDGPLAPVSCVSQTAYERCRECISEERCEIRFIMKEVRDAMSAILDKTSLSDLLERSQRDQNIENFMI